MEFFEIFTEVFTFLINKVIMYPWPSLIIFLTLFFYFAFIRRVRYEGIQETIRGNDKHIWTDSVTGTTFPTDNRIIGVGELASRRQKFGKAVWSWILTAIVIAGVTIALTVIASS